MKLLSFYTLEKHPAYKEFTGKKEKAILKFIWDGWRYNHKRGTFKDKHGTFYSYLYQNIAVALDCSKKTVVRVVAKMKRLGICQTIKTPRNTKIYLLLDDEYFYEEKDVEKEEKSARTFQEDNTQEPNYIKPSSSSENNEMSLHKKRIIKRSIKKLKQKINIKHILKPGNQGVSSYIIDLNKINELPQSTVMMINRLEKEGYSVNNHFGINMPLEKVINFYHSSYLVREDAAYDSVESLNIDRFNYMLEKIIRSGKSTLFSPYKRLEKYAQKMLHGQSDEFVLSLARNKMNQMPNFYYDWLEAGEA